MDNKLTHFDNKGNAVMVDVSNKNETERIAIATGTVKASSETIELIKSGQIGKGDVLGVARVAGIMAMKNTSNLIPMCHPVMITGSSIDFEIDSEKNEIRITATSKVVHKTGVEMEALTGVSIVALTIYDMCKAVDKRMVIGDIHLVKN
ncbi:cyclic pyranopterin monophosphate synthase MoaC [Clostridium perfringens]|nr:cyclic pyranopterin monophosphate synthase MoaC [Clostridium perfringens]